MSRLPIATCSIGRAAALLASAMLSWLVIPAHGLESVEEILQCLRQNLPERTIEQSIELRSEDRVGGVRFMSARLHWKRFDSGARLRIRVDSPADVRGSSYLVIQHEHGDEMFVYLPTLLKVRRITGSAMGNALWGTDFSYEDIKQILGISIEGTSEREPDATVGDRGVYVLSMTPDNTAISSYTRLKFFVDHQTCVALVTEFYEQRKSPRKILRVDPAHLHRDGARWSSEQWEMRDLRDETRSWLHIIVQSSDVDIPDRIFSPALLGRGR